MRRRTFLASAAASWAAPPRPNVLFLLTDDQSYGTLSLTGSRVVKTPHIDRIGREGVLFRNFFVTTSLCAPSRATFLTGLYAHTHGIHTLREKWNQALPTWPRALQAAGYRTAFIGKFHMDHDDRVQPGFDYWAAQVSQGEYVNPRKNVNGQWVDLKGYDTHIVTDQALEFLENTKGGRPWCVCLAYKAPHAPFTPAPGYETFLANHDFPVHPDFSRENTGKPSRLRERQKPTKATGGSVWPLDEFAERERNYYRCLMGVEDSVGRLLGYLDGKGLAENTLIVYSSDNGFFHGEHGLQTKMEAYEESIRVPTLFRFPARVKAGQTVDAMTASVDVQATILDYCGVPQSAPSHGGSWRPLVDGTRAPRRRDAFLYEYFGMGPDVDPRRPLLKALRTERHKLIVSLNPAGIDELYDLERDPREKTNLALDPAHATLVARLKRRMREIMKETADPAWEAISA